MKKPLFGLMVAVLLISGCATAATPATPTSAEVSEVQLAPFTDQHFGLQGLRPVDWAEVQPGTVVQNASAPYLPQLIYGAYAGMTMEWADVFFSHQLGLEQLPDSTGSYESPSFAWELTTFDVNHPEMGEIVVDGALAETDDALFVVAVLARGDEYEPLHEALLLPILEALRPLDAGRREKLTRAQLMACEGEEDSPVNNLYFTAMGEASAPLHELQGTLSVPEFQMQSSPAGEQYCPGFTVEFFTHDGYLVPAARDITPSSGGKSFWSIILSPGKVWSETGDAGMSRSSFPFLLVAPQSNEAHNGLATFVYDETSVSCLYVQVVQETAAWKKNDLWGQTMLEYAPGRLEDLDDLKTTFVEELSVQTPIRPWSHLEERYDARLLSTFNLGHQPWDVSVSGLVLDDTIYLQPCLTRYGEFPYCRHMRHGVFSVTKSMGAAVAMLRLAQKYGEGVFDLRIVDYVEVTASHDGWAGVTFGDALNMATGIGDNPNITSMTAEEDQPRFSRFLEARSAQDKLDVCFSYGNYPWGPGEAARYNSMNTFVLSVAMTNFLESKEGPEADIWDMVLDEVYAPIGIQHAPIMRTHEPDGSKGVPIFGYGLYPTVDDVAKVASLFHDGGKFQGQQLLHGGRLAQALYQTEVTGLPTGDRNANGEFKYHMSFWGMPYRTSAGESLVIPYMSGYGGNHVALLPNGITAFRFSDAHVYGVESMVRVAAAIRPF